MALVRAKGNVNAASYIDGATALHYAKEGAVCRALIRAGAMNPNPTALYRTVNPNPDSSRR